MNFGFRARDESRKLCWGDVKLQVDSQTGREFLVWSAERGSKTRQGKEGGHRRKFEPKIFATGKTRCPVMFYKTFESHRSDKSKDPESPFFLSVNQNWQKTNVWYKNAPLGKNSIGKFLSQAAERAGLPPQNKKVANHSVRKTGIGRLLDAGTPENFVCQLTGHKNLQSLSSYKSASLHHQRSMSDVLLRSEANENTLLQSRCSESASFTHSQSKTCHNSVFDVFPGQSLFCGATIGSLNNCVFNINSCVPECSSAKRQRIEQ